MSENGVIGQQGDIPWHLEEDLRRFKEITMGHPVIMGRKTMESLPSPLDRRLNVILTEQEKVEGDTFEFSADNTIRTVSYDDQSSTRMVGCSSVSDALSLVDSKGFHDAYIIGGEEVYESTASHIHEVRMTLVHDTYEGDTFYPLADELETSDWSKTFVDPKEEFSFIDYTSLDSS
jgi:dihydrofolate reductase